MKRPQLLCALVCGSDDLELSPLERREGLARKMLHSYDWEGALENCREVLMADPDHLGALEVMAQAQWFGGEYEAVIRTTSRLLRLNPHEPGYRFTRGMALISKGELLRASEDFRRAIQQSDNPGFRAQVAEALDAVELWIEDQTLRPPVRSKLPKTPGSAELDRSAFRYH